MRSKKTRSVLIDGRCSFDLFGGGAKVASSSNGCVGASLGRFEHPRCVDFELAGLGAQFSGELAEIAGARHGGNLYHGPRRAS